MRLQPRLSSSLIMFTVYTTQAGTLCISSEFPEFGRALSSLPSIRDCFNAVPTQVYIMILPKRRTNIQPCMCIIYVYLCVYVYMNTYILRLIHTITTTGKSKIYIYYLSSAFFFCFGFGWHKPRYLWEQGISVEKMPPSALPIDVPVGHFLDLWLMWEGPAS